MSTMRVLRAHIFETMDGLRKGDITVPVANAMAGSAQVILNSLKVELEARKLSGDKTLPTFMVVEKGSTYEITDEERKAEEAELSKLLPLSSESGVTVHIAKHE